MCSWERFCTFAREPEQRKVDGCARVSVSGVAYEVDPDLAGETVVLWWGLFDNELVDEAHDLHSSTLTGLKRLIELAEDGGAILSIVLAGHPKLKNDLRRPTMEEIGYRTAIFSLDSLAGEQQQYIQWLLSECTAEGTPVDYQMSIILIGWRKLF